MEILLIHHLEPIWDSALRNMSGEGFHYWASKLAETIEEENLFRRIILTQFENFEATSEHHDSGLVDLVDQWEEYGYGWHEGPYINSRDYTEGGGHSEYVWTPEWIKELKGNKITLCGAFDGECLEDMEIALDACEVSYNRWEEFII